MKNFSKYLTIFFVLLFFISCSNTDSADKNEANTNSSTNVPNENSKTNNSNNNRNTNKPENETTDPSFHRNNNYKYEYRIGKSGNYQYNYDIEGYDNEGNYITGNVDMDGKYGSGTIYDEDGNEKSIEVEWYDYGQMQGTDEDGNNYEFEAEE